MLLVCEAKIEALMTPTSASKVATLATDSVQYLATAEVYFLTSIEELRDASRIQKAKPRRTPQKTPEPFLLC